MRQTACVGLAVLAGTMAVMASASGQIDREATPIYGVRLPAGYRDWPLISVAITAENVPVGISPADHAAGIVATLANLAAFVEG